MKRQSDQFFKNYILFVGLIEDLSLEYNFSDSSEGLFRPILFFRSPRT